MISKSVHSLPTRSKIKTDMYVTTIYTLLYTLLHTTIHITIHYYIHHYMYYYNIFKYHKCKMRQHWKQTTLLLYRCMNTFWWIISLADGPNASDLRRVLWRVDVGAVGGDRGVSVVAGAARGDVGVTAGDEIESPRQLVDDISESNDTLLSDDRLGRISEISASSSWFTEIQHLGERETRKREMRERIKWTNYVIS